MSTETTRHTHLRQHRRGAKGLRRLRHLGALTFALATLVALGVGALLPTTSQAAEQTAGGTLQLLDEASEALAFCPLEHTDVESEIAGNIARVTVTQSFQNPLSEEEDGGTALEAVYTFPLSDRAAVDRMVMRVGDRVIRGKIHKREEAREIYEQARREGKAAGLLDQERPNIFTQSVANIMPGQDVEIEISYVEYLPYEDGAYTFSFPMVVGPRYVPGQSSPSGTGTDQVPDAGKITPPITPEDTRAGHDISLGVRVAAGVPIHDLRSELHEVTVKEVSVSERVVALKNQETIPNRDFVLHYTVAGDEIDNAVLTHHDDQGGFFSLIFQPPKRVAPEEIQPKEMIFVIDSSGSMNGFPIEKAKKTMRLCIEKMHPRDKFNLISFAGGTGYCFAQSAPNTEANRKQALAYLQSLSGRGGTEMMGAIRAALAGPYDDERLRIVCFMTDGLIGNDMAILDEIKGTADNARVFPFGIGNSVNRFLIEKMAATGRGAAEIVTLEAKGDEAAQRFFERTRSPLLTDLEIDFGGLQVESVYPTIEALPDLFAARPLVLTGRYTQSGQGTVTLRGNAADGPYEAALDVTLPADKPEYDVLAPLWARRRIDHLMAQDWRGIQQGNPDAEIKEQITRLGLDFGLMTQFTSFVAVEEQVVNEGGETKRIEVPVEMPDGVSYEGVFGRQGNARGAAKGAGYRTMSMGGASSMAPVDHMAPQTPRAETQPAPPPRREYTAEIAEEKPAPDTAPKPEAGDLKNSAAALAKLHTELKKLLRGESHKVAVQDSAGRVYARLDVIEQAHLDALKRAGFEIIAVARSSNRVMLRAPVENLVALAEFDFVVSVEPVNLKN
ncbi:MAG: VIT and vWA domain-containing protein [Candidatus Hydrogenedentota bacterium]